MALLGRGALAICHDIAPEGRELFYAWHGQEHMPERLGIPGFLRGRRYVGIDASLEFFNLYETVDLDVLKGAAYTDRVNNPTPWTRQAVAHFRSVARSICEVDATFGHAQGGLLATLRYDVPVRSAHDHRDRVEQDWLPALAAQPGVAGAHLLVADTSSSSASNAEQRARGVANAVPRWILLLEGWGDEAAFKTLVRTQFEPRKLRSFGAAGDAELDCYRHQVTHTAPA